MLVGRLLPLGLLLFVLINVINSAMVKLTVTAAAKTAIREYCRAATGSADIVEANDRRKESISKLEIGSPIEHEDLIEISRFLVNQCQRENKDDLAKNWRLETLLKGANVYQPPPPPKPEPVSYTSEYLLWTWD
jgi:hypothetical protein